MQQAEAAAEDAEAAAVAAAAEQVAQVSLSGLTRNAFPAVISYVESATKFWFQRSSKRAFAEPQLSGRADMMVCACVQ